MSPQVVHNRAALRFEVEVEGRRCVAEYRIAGKLMTMTHTYVPPRLEGHGIAAVLVAQALAFARQEGLRVRPACSYVSRYMQRHPDTLDLCEDPAD